MARISTSSEPNKPEQTRRLLPWGTVGAYLLAGAVFCVVATLGFVSLADEIFENEFTALDNGLIAWVHSHSSPTLDQVMLFFTTIGEPVVLGLVITLASIALLRMSRWMEAIGAIVAAAGCGILNPVLKEMYRRVRPDLFQGPFHLNTYSFPSGHAMGSIVCYGILAYIGIRLLHRRWQKIVLAIITTLLVLCIGFSRVYFGVHFPTDVAGGYIAGAIWLVITILIIQAADWHVARRRAARRRNA